MSNDDKGNGWLLALAVGMVALAIILYVSYINAVINK